MRGKSKGNKRRKTERRIKRWRRKRRRKVDVKAKIEETRERGGE